jgi:hypothetical protein
MARYIDADALLNKIPDDLPYKASVKRVLIQAPTADVAPKSEVASMPHKCKDCAGCTQWKCDCANIELEVAREIFEEIEDVLNHIGYFDELDFNALKKKYTGEQT